MRSVYPIALLIAVLTCISLASNQNKPADTIVLNRVYEPNERAFSILAPKGWQTEGGITRVDPLSSGGPGNSIAAKLDFALKSDSYGAVKMHWLPDVMFYDPRMSPAGQMGMFPPGSNYQGMPVQYVMPADQFLLNVAFPYAHPNASNVQVVSSKKLPDIAQKFWQRESALLPMKKSFSYDAAIIHVKYSDGGQRYEEKMFGVIENWGQLGTGMWNNRETFLLRTPVGEYTMWEPVLSLMQKSVKINPQWLKGEIQGQITRGQIVLDTQAEIQRIEREITEHRQKTNAEIHNDMFLTLTDQEEYVNPYTKEVETGSNQWQHRWVNESGDVIYTDKESYDPNVDINLNRSDYKRTPVRDR